MAYALVAMATVQVMATRAQALRPYETTLFAPDLMMCLRMTNMFLRLNIRRNKVYGSGIYGAGKKDRGACRPFREDGSLGRDRQAGKESRQNARRDLQQSLPLADCPDR